MIMNSFFLLCMSAITAVGLVLWWRILTTVPEQRSQYLKPWFPTPVGMLDFLVAFMIWIGVPSIATIWLPFDVADFDQLDGGQRNILLLAMATAQLIGCGILLLYLFVRYGSVSWLVNLTTGLAAHISLAVKTFCMIVPFILGVQALLSLVIQYEHDTLSLLSDNFSPLTVFATWYGAVLAAPICEELIFRGVLQGWLQRVVLQRSDQDKLSELIGGWSSQTDADVALTRSASLDWQRFRWWFPIFASSAVFAAIHLGQGAAPIPLFLFAIGLGFLFRFSGSLIPCIILHFMLNAFTMFWTTLQLIVENG